MSEDHYISETKLDKKPSYEEIAEIVHQLEKEAIRKSKEHFETYVHLIAPTLMPDTYKTGPHVSLMCAELQEVYEKTILSIADPKEHDAPRLMINLPPGSMKTLVLCLFVTWVFGKRPKWRIIHLGHSGEFAIDMYGAQTRDIIKTPEYQQIFPGITIREDTDSKGRWSTNRGGQYVAKGVGQKITGRRAHIAIVDDPLSAQDAESKVERERKNNWYTPGLQTRLLPGASEVLVMHRWHLDDLAGNRLAKDNKIGAPRPWKVFKIPALNNEETAELLDLPVGTSFWPDLWPTKMFEEKMNEAGMSRSFWSAQYMQEPTPEEGNIIKARLIQDWQAEEPPEVDYVLVSIDTAFSTKERADYSAYTVWGIFKQTRVDTQGNERRIPCMILLEAERGRWEFPELCAKVERIYSERHPDSFIIENKASGQSLIQELYRRGFPVLKYNPDTDKISKTYSCQGFFEAKRIFVPLEKGWAKEVVNELVSFPSAPHDDFTDTVTQAILWMRDNWQIDADGYTYNAREEDEDENAANVFRGKKTYWSVANNGRN